jgi:hypothetical protein
VADYAFPKKPRGKHGAGGLISNQEHHRGEESNEEKSIKADSQ